MSDIVRCPGCERKLEPVPPVASRHSEQWDKIKAGDWFCRHCPPGTAGGITGGISNFLYFSDSDLRRSSPDGQCGSSPRPVERATPPVTAGDTNGDNDTTDALVNPQHYRRLSPEPIDVLTAWQLPGPLYCAARYLVRAGHKPGADPRTDLRKAIRYIEAQIAYLSKEDST